MRFFLEVDKMILNFIWRINVWENGQEFFFKENMKWTAPKQSRDNIHPFSDTSGQRPGSPARLLLSSGCSPRGQGMSSSLLTTHFRATSPKKEGLMCMRNYSLHKEQKSTRKVQKHTGIQINSLMESGCWKEEKDNPMNALLGFQY